MRIRKFSFLEKYDSQSYLQNVREFLKKLSKMKYMCVNIDYDGMLTSCLIKSVFPNIKIVGFNDGKNHIWIKKGYEDKEMVWVDYHINGGMCIDQHVTTNKSVKFDGNMYNPNILLEISNQNYGDKYPFGIYHILRADLEKLGYNLKNINLDFSIMDVCKLVEIEMRADSTLGSFVNEKYREKSREYRKIMCEDLKEDSITNRFFSEMDKQVLGGVNNSNTYDKWKRSFTKKVRKTFDITNGTGYKSLSCGFFNLFEEIHKAFGLEFDIDTNQNNYIDNKLVRFRYSSSDQDCLDTISNDERVVSGIFPYKNTFSLQVEPQDAKGIANEYWEHLDRNKHINERCMDENGRTVFIRRSNEDGSGYFEKKVGSSKKSEWVMWND